MKNKIHLIVVFLGLAVSASGQTVFWGSDIFADHFEIDGVTRLDSSYTYQIGSFADGVDPLSAQPNELSDAWRVFDEATYVDDPFYYFDSKANLDANGYSDGVNAAENYDFRGEQLYIWVYDENTPALDGVTEHCHEWALFTGDWTIPETADQTTLPLEFRTSTADSGAPIYGGLNDLHAMDGGTYVDVVSFELQTHEICLDPVPEPSGVALLLLGGMMLLGRRCR